LDYLYANKYKLQVFDNERLYKSELRIELWKRHSRSA
jgi:hypothetical protein